MWAAAGGPTPGRTLTVHNASAHCTLCTLKDDVAQAKLPAARGAKGGVAKGRCWRAGIVGWKGEPGWGVAGVFPPGPKHFAAVQAMLCEPCVPQGLCTWGAQDKCQRLMLHRRAATRWVVLLYPSLSCPAARRRPHCGAHAHPARPLGSETPIWEPASSRRPRKAVRLTR